MFRKGHVEKGACSERGVFRKGHVQKGACSERGMFRKDIVQKRAPYNEKEETKMVQVKML